ncbi:ArsB/NhaD family transporter [Candidatus Peregrinibacteria bacterium]|nr:ArsB/NhaD family transporter [Candidatus Peregrinibacteria bacterium]
MLTTNALIAIIVFLLVYAFIITEKVHKSIVVILGSLLLLLFRVFLSPEFETQFAHSLSFIDFNVLALIIGMMIIVQITSKSGIFTHIAMKTIVLTRGNMLITFFLLMLFTAFITAFISNVTAVMVMTPIFLAICLRYDLNPLPFLMTEIIISNVGGTATPLGDMTNIIIASRAGFSFAKVVTNLAPVVTVISIVLTSLALFHFRKKLIPKNEISVNDLRTESFIQNKPLLIKGISILVLVIISLMFKENIGLDNGIIALSGAMILLLITKIEPEEAFKKYVNWSIIFFFIGLFIIIGALEATGVVKTIAETVVAKTGDNINLLTMIMVFASSIFSAFIDNIPFATTMIPIIRDIGIMTGVNTDPLFWALALGACIGGSGTIIGASCNLVVVGLAEHNGIKITFLEYFKYAFVMMMIGVLIAAAYLFFFVLN